MEEFSVKGKFSYIILLENHMSDLELLFSQLEEAAITEITKTEHPQGFEKNKADFL